MTRQPGVLLVRQGPDDVFMFSPGQVAFFNKDAHFDSTTLRLLIAKAFYEGRAFPDRYQSATKIIDMACVALDGGYGATVLVVPSGMDARALDKPKYSVHESTRKILASALRDPGGVELGRSVARIAFIDGALLLDEFGMLKGAGAMIRTEEVPDVTPRAILIGSASAR